MGIRRHVVSRKLGFCQCRHAVRRCKGCC